MLTHSLLTLVSKQNPAQTIAEHRGYAVCCAITTTSTCTLMALISREAVHPPRLLHRELTPYTCVYHRLLSAVWYALSTLC